MDSLYNILISHFKTQIKVGRHYGVSRQAVSRWKVVGVPEEYATLAHLTPDIPYTYDPSHYGRDEKALGLNLVKPTDDQMITSEEIANDKPVHSEAA